MLTTESATTYWAVVTRGLEEVAQAEIDARLPVSNTVRTAYRRVMFTTSADPTSMLTLRTVDDVFVDLGTWERIARPRVALIRLEDRARELDLRQAAVLCRAVREIGTPPSFSITANFVGKRNYSTDEIKHAVANGVEASHGWEYRERDAEADLNIRVFIEHERAFLGMRLAQSPLHERPYKIATIAGSLKPTIAAAMIQMGKFEAGATILDPLCGAGTIPIEATQADFPAIGGDIEVTALEAAGQNAQEAGVSIVWQQWDARSLPFETASVGGVVTNLPWGRQIAVDQDLTGFYRACLREMARIVRPGNAIVVLTSLQTLLTEAATDAELTIEEEREISLFGQTPTITILRGQR